MKKIVSGAACAVLLAACSKPAPAPEAAPPPPAPKLVSGIEPGNNDPAVRAQDDLYRAVDGQWLAKTEIPADKSNYGAFTKLADDAEAQLRAIIEAAAKNPNKKAGSEEQKIGDLYTSFMDEAKVEEAGVKPLEPELALIDGLKSKKDIAQLLGHDLLLQVPAPVAAEVHQDAKDPSKYIIDFKQGGLGLPDRDYYLSGDAKFKEIRTQYLAYIEKMYGLAGLKDGARAAKAVLELETKLAQIQWPRVETRDAVKTYNPQDAAKLAALTPALDWKALLKEGQIPEQPFYVVSEPNYLSGLSKLISSVPLADWQSYFRFKLINDRAPLLSKALVDENFHFNGTVLNGIAENRPRWKRGVQMIEVALGEAVGHIYVDQHFPPEAKARMDQLVGNLLAAYKQGIDGLEWMGADTKKAAQEKLAKFMPKIGYPKKWKDYSALTVAPDDLYGNMTRSAQVEALRQINKLGKPVDRDEWGMTPQTVNAYYNPELNEIVFPAAILQPPFFNMKADDAVNYGGIGAVIGHEISHGFDDQGARYDGDGVLRDWWTADDLKNFKAKTEALIAQYSSYEPLPGVKLNGAFTIGENIADLSGMTIAYKAYKLSLNGKPAPVIDGLTGEQRFFMGWAQVWRRKYKDENLLARIKTDPHSPSEFRCNGVVINMPEFDAAFGVKEGDKLYKPAAEQIKIW
ncbi:MAG TPA: M13-type metalloendopeptidase [Nevskiaceae bacterium]|nr:M13-type metalloendopeptidase [Nevskiaceae bacterium]